MARFFLDENDQIEATGDDVRHGKGIEEILYFPQISKDLGDNSERNLQEVWVLEGKRFDAFIAETKKYDEAAQGLADAQATGDPAQIKAAQDQMREALAMGFGKKKGEHLIPVPQESYKGLIECIGKVSRRVYYISNYDLKKVQKTNGRSGFRFPFEVMKNKKRDVYDFLNVMEEDNARENRDELEKDDPVRQKFMELKVQIQKEWKFLEKKKEGQVKVETITKLVTNETVRKFLLDDETCTLVNDAIKFFNDTANFSIDQKEQKRQEIAKLLEKPDGEFGHYEWGLVLIGIQEIWNKTEPKFLTQIKNDYENRFLDSTNKRNSFAVEKKPHR